MPCCSALPRCRTEGKIERAGSGRVAVQQQLYGHGEAVALRRLRSALYEIRGLLPLRQAHLGVVVVCFACVWYAVHDPAVGACQGVTALSPDVGRHVGGNGPREGWSHACLGVHILHAGHCWRGSLEMTANMMVDRAGVCASAVCFKTNKVNRKGLGGGADLN